MNKVKTPWPTKEAMTQVYENELWGGCEFDFYSGDGSHVTEIIQPYISVVQNFLKSLDEKLTVLDLGCGDFNIGKELVHFSKKYIAIDIVEELIAYNEQKFHSDNLSFHSLDIAKDDLPDADCVIIRQVLQHLSNAEIKQVLRKLTKYKYVILTEHMPEGEFTPNIDIISGQGTRLKKNSGVDVTVKPFNFKIKLSKELLVVKPKKQKGEIKTVLYTT